jgi:hypothetical protein
MADLSVFNLSRERPTIFSAFNEGRKQRQERELNNQASAINEQVITQNKQAIEQKDRSMKSQELGELGEQDSQRMLATVNSAIMMQSIPNANRIEFLNNRIEQFRQNGIPIDDLENIKELIQVGKVQEADDLIDMAAKMKNQVGGRKVQSSSFTQLTNKDGSTVPAQAVTYNDGTSELVALQAPEGYEIPEAETPQQKRQAQFHDFTQRQRLETEEAANRAFNNAIASGEATDMANAKRGIITGSTNLRKARELKTLLSGFETGGFTQGMANTMQSFFGVRPADEEEANNLMQAQALSLLANFKGSISDSERDFVLSMTPNFGLSTEGNMRIINNFIEDAENQVKLGDAAMGGKDAYDTYIKGLVKDSGIKITESDILKEYGEDKIQAIALQRGISAEDVIKQAIEEKNARAAMQ